MLLDELRVVCNHLGSNALLLQLSVERSPFLRRLVVVVDGSRVAQSGSRFSSRTNRGLFCRSSLLERNGVFVLDGILAGVLFSVLYSLEQMGRFRFVFKQKAGKTVLQLHRVEKRSVLEVVDADVQFLVPQHAARAVDVNELEEQRMAH